VNGALLESSRWHRRSQWTPDGPGFAEITVVDALGRRARVDIRLLEPAP
jgi:membrane carboxypeptidase/penicillin-binding protein PbpC